VLFCSFDLGIIFDAMGLFRAKNSAFPFTLPNYSYTAESAEA